MDRFLITERAEVCTEGVYQNPKLNIRNSKLKNHLSLMNFTYRQVVVLFIASMALVMLGLLFKIQHWAYGSMAISAGLMAQVVAIVLLVLLLVKRK
jgi:hypothetical protein